MQAGAEARQKRKFLEAYFIDDADIPGVGPTRKAALRSFGIETAADVTSHRVLQVPGFGEGLTRAVMSWRTACERRFRFNAATAVTEADRNVVRAKIQQRRLVLESLLSKGATSLKALRDTSILRGSSYLNLLQQKATAVAQAEVDLEAVPKINL